MRDLKFKKIYQLDMREFDELIQEVYGIEYDVQQGEYSQDSFIDVDNADGKPKSYQGYWTKMKEGKYGDHDLNDAQYVDLDENDVIDYWRTHNPSVNGVDLFRPLTDLNDKGAHAWWQPEVDWIVNDMVKKEEIPAGDYQILIWW